MSSTPHQMMFLEANEPAYWVHHQIALLIEIALDRGIKEEKLLRNTGIFRSDIFEVKKRVSANSVRQLIHNICSQGKGVELSLLWGSQLYPGHYGPVSTLIAHSGTLKEFLESLVRFRHLLCPLLVPRIVEDKKWCYLYWLDGVGAGTARPFMANALMAATRSASNWLAGERLPWQVFLRADDPKAIPAFEVAFGHSVKIGTGIDLMRIDRASLFSPWPTRSKFVQAASRFETEESFSESQWHQGLPELIYATLIGNRASALSQNLMSEKLGMSPATLKRRLKDCQTTYQGLQDEARFHMALYLFYVRGYSHDHVARNLNCSDSANFRRMFKRWTGFTPKSYLRVFS